MQFFKKRGAYFSVLHALKSTCMMEETSQLARMVWNKMWKIKHFT